jgi:hypothetical protein
VIYSVHNPVSGAFDYFEGGPATPINDDLPTPQFKGAGRIGVAASSAARPLPPGSRKVGSGALPVGCISSGKPGLWKGTSKGGAPSGIAGVGDVFDHDLRNVALAAGAFSLLGLGAWLILRSMRDTEEFDYGSLQRRTW